MPEQKTPEQLKQEWIEQQRVDEQNRAGIQSRIRPLMESKA